jgi:predicted nucleic acid-binding protein
LERRGWPLEYFHAAVSEGQDAAIASITASELLVGVHRADDELRRQRRQSFIETIFQQLPVISFDLEAARVHARIWSDLSASGQMSAAHDLIIAATALANGFLVLSENIRELSRVAGLDARRPAW